MLDIICILIYVIIVFVGMPIFMWKIRKMNDSEFALMNKNLEELKKEFDLMNKNLKELKEELKTEETTSE